MSDIENCQSVTLQGYIKTTAPTTFNYDMHLYGNELKFVPDVCIVRAVNFLCTDNNTQAYRYTSGILLWSNLNNNFIATINPIWNPSNTGTITVTGNYTSNPHNVINLRGKTIPNVLQFQFYNSTNNSATPLKTH